MIKETTLSYRAKPLSIFLNPRSLVIYAILFVFISLLLIRLLGLDYLGKTIETHMQFLDIPLLREKPFLSILYTHSQPPLLNIIAWLLSLLPSDLYLNFIILNALCSYVTGLIIYDIAQQYLGSSTKALAITLAYWASPAAFLYVTYPFYPCLTAVGYATLLYSFFISQKNPSFALRLLAVSIVYLSLLRSSFTILHALGAFFAFYWYIKIKPKKKDLVWAASVVLIGITIVPVKNFVLYDFWGSSSWGPLNLAKGMGINDGLGPFPLPEAIRKKYPDLKCAHMYGIQDREDKRQNGWVNFNSCYLIEYANIVRPTLLKNYQFKKHLKNSFDSMLIYFSPSEKYPFVENRVRIAPYANAFNGLFMSAPILGTEIRILLIILIVTSIFHLYRTRDKFIAVALSIVGIHFLSHVLVDGGESSRFVFDIEFIFWIFLAIALGCATKPSDTSSARVQNA